MIVVTGASGFVGRHLVAELRSRGEEVRSVVRPGSALRQDAVVASLDRPGDWPRILDGASAVVHLAAHNPRPGARTDAEAFQRVNVDGTALLARQAAMAGVPRFVFASSTRVYGAGTGEAWDEDAALMADDPYGRSKREAEAAVASRLSGTATDWTALRPPMIYGPGRGGVVQLLHRLVRSGLPVPLPQPDVRRSVLYVGNATAAILACLASEAAANQTVNLSDGPAPTYRELAEAIGEAIGRKPRFLPLPAFAANVVGNVPIVGRLSLPSVCDDSRIRALVGWSPPFSTGEGLRLTFAGAGKG